MCHFHPNQTGFFSLKRLVVICSALLTVASFLLFLIYEADDMMESVNSAYFMTTLLGIFGSFIHISSKTATVFQLIDDDVGVVIEESKYISPYYIFLMRQNTVKITF